MGHPRIIPKHNRTIRIVHQGRLHNELDRHGLI
jgi:hypothetical protein